VINESGLYDLIFVSRKPAAKEFKRKVTTEILPEIRRSGVYLGTMTLQEALRKYADALDEKDQASKRAIAAESYANELRPVVMEHEAFMNCEGVCDLGALAQALGGGRQRLVDRLRELGVLVSRAASQGGVRPMQPYSENEGGWFVVKMEATNVGPVSVAYATPKGVSQVFRALVKHGLGERRWGALPTEAELFQRITFVERTSLSSTELTT
jgi:anti-repressor protein